MPAPQCCRILNGRLPNSLDDNIIAMFLLDASRRKTDSTNLPTKLNTRSNSKRSWYAQHVTETTQRQSSRPRSIPNQKSQNSQDY